MLLSSAMRVMFLVMLVCVSVCLSIRKQSYLKSNERICIKMLPEVALGPRTNPLYFVDDPNYDQM